MYICIGPTSATSSTPFKIVATPSAPPSLPRYYLRWASPHPSYLRRVGWVGGIAEATNSIYICFREVHRGFEILKITNVLSPKSKSLDFSKWDKNLCWTLRFTLISITWANFENQGMPTSPEIDLKACWAIGFAPVFKKSIRLRNPGIDFSACRAI